jgi:hypothetical protein
MTNTYKQKIRKDMKPTKIQNNKEKESKKSLQKYFDLGLARRKTRVRGTGG